MRTSIGRIALAVVLAEALLNFLRTLAWDLVIPILARIFSHQSESVLFERRLDKPIAWDLLFYSALQLLLAVIFVVFVHRWIRRRPATLNAEGDVTEGTEPEEAMTKGAGQE